MATLSKEDLQAWVDYFKLLIEMEKKLAVKTTTESKDSPQKHPF